MSQSARATLFCLAAILVVPAARGQARTRDSVQTENDAEQEPLTPTHQEASPIRAGRTAESTVGYAGQRQTRDQLASIVRPMGRIQNRVQNRVRVRISNRIDRNYDPQANGSSPFLSAEEQARTTGRPDR